MVCLCLCLQDAQVSSGGQRRRRRVRHHPVRRRPALRGPGVQGPSVLATALPEPFYIACLLCSAPHTCSYPRILPGLCYPVSGLSPSMSCPDLPTADHQPGVGHPSQVWLPVRLREGRAAAALQLQAQLLPQIDEERGRIERRTAAPDTPDRLAPSSSHHLVYTVHSISFPACTALHCTAAELSQAREEEYSRGEAVSFPPERWRFGDWLDENSCAVTIQGIVAVTVVGVGFVG